jgi:hypothetical protein
VFLAQRERLDTLAKARESETRAMHELIREAYGLGVNQSVLARWSGYTVRWTMQILGKA